MFIEKIANLKNGIKLNEFAENLVCGINQNGEKIYCDSYTVIKIDGNNAILITSSAAEPHSSYLFTDFEVVDLNNLASYDSLHKIRDQWIRFVERTLTHQRDIKAYHQALFAHVSDDLTLSANN